MAHPTSPKASLLANAALGTKTSTRELLGDISDPNCNNYRFVCWLVTIIINITDVFLDILLRVKAKLGAVLV